MAIKVQPPSQPPGSSGGGTPVSTSITDFFERRDGLLGAMESGRAWAGNTTAFRINDGRVVKNPATASGNYTTYIDAPEAPATAVSASALIHPNSSSRFFLTLNQDAADATTYLFAELHFAAGQNAVRLRKRVAGTATDLATNEAAGLIQDHTYRITLTRSAAALTVSVVDLSIYTPSPSVNLSYTLTGGEQTSFSSTRHGFGYNTSSGENGTTLFDEWSLTFTTASGDAANTTALLATGRQDIWQPFRLRGATDSELLEDYDTANTLHFIGDMHVGRAAQARLDAVQSDLQNNLPVPARYVQIGDSTQDGITAQDTVALAWLNSLPAGWLSINGNHDTSLDVRTVAAWETAYGMNRRQVVDFTTFKLVLIGPDATPATDIVIPQATIDWAAAQIDASTVPVVIGCHAPLKNTVLGWRPATTGNFYANDDTAIRAMLANREAVVAWVSGHTHSHPWKDKDFVKREKVGSRYLAHVNTSSLYYVGQNLPQITDPLTTFPVTVDPSGDGVDVRCYEHNLKRWVPMRPFGPRPTLRNRKAAPAVRILTTDGVMSAALAAGTRVFPVGVAGGATSGGGGNNLAPPFVVLNKADYPGCTRLRLNVSLASNVAQTGVTFTFGLFPVAWSGTTNVIPTLGAAVPGSTVTLSGVGATSELRGMSGDFAFPAEDSYVIGLVTDAATAASSRTFFTASLYGSN